MKKQKQKKTIRLKKNIFFIHVSSEYQKKRYLGNLKQFDLYRIPTDFSILAKNIK